ncbi:hypothetical protein PENTCL1PPCAC_7772, partial [Pristionchus entomophagus]
TRPLASNDNVVPPQLAPSTQTRPEDLSLRSTHRPRPQRQWRSVGRRAVDGGCELGDLAADRRPQQERSQPRSADQKRICESTGHLCHSQSAEPDPAGYRKNPQSDCRRQTRTDQEKEGEEMRRSDMPKDR